MINGDNLSGKVTIVVHGGAWKIPKYFHEPTRKGVKKAAKAGYRVLRGGGSCVDAVVAAVSSLEDNPYFDAGRGSVLNENKEVEMHSLVMRGDTLDAGGVLCIKHIKNPCQAARLVLNKSHHCLLSGKAAYKLAKKHQLPEEDLSYFVTEAAWKEFEEMGDYNNTLEELFNGSTGHDTVGAVALDEFGNVACCTSTGGITRQVAGRVSDSGLIGSGGYADNYSAAISTTGHGESIMKVNLARLVSMRHANDGNSLQGAAEDSLKYMKKRVRGCGGIISVDRKGNVGIAHSTPHMSWAKITEDQNIDEVVCEFGLKQDEFSRRNIKV